jgi:hypothetical protein
LLNHALEIVEVTFERLGLDWHDTLYTPYLYGYEHLQKTLNQQINLEINKVITDVSLSTDVSSTNKRTTLLNSRINPEKYV